MEPFGDVDPDRLGETGGFVQPRLDVAPGVAVAEIGESDDGAGAAGELVRGIAVERTQAGCSSSWVSRLIGPSG
jgi:hypothetical protein